MRYKWWKILLIIFFIIIVACIVFSIYFGLECLGIKQITKMAVKGDLFAKN